MLIFVCTDVLWEKWYGCVDVLVYGGRVCGATPHCDYGAKASILFIVYFTFWKLNFI